MRQPRLHWSAYLWPGLPQVWLRGSWVGLTLAVGFTALANVLMAATLVWDEWLPVRERWIAVAALAAIWIIAGIDARADWRRLLAQWSADDETMTDPDEATAQQSDQWFREAQTAYLEGDWVSAEQTLLKLLRHDARDAESRLMLATLWRHEGRADAASEQLDRLACLETAAPWHDEISRERERMSANCVVTKSQNAPSEDGKTTQRTASPGLARSGLNNVAESKPTSSDAPIATTHRRMAA